MGLGDAQRLPARLLHRLVIAGIRKASLISHGAPFDHTITAIAPYMTLFAYTGIGIFAGLSLILAPLTRTLLQVLTTPEPQEQAATTPAHRPVLEERTPSKNALSDPLSAPVERSTHE